MAANEREGEEFQKRYLEARHLTSEQMDLAIRHGLEAQTRFADRPFEEVDHYLRESWNGMGPPAPWDDVADIIRSAYEWQRAAGVDRSIWLGEDAASRFIRRTIGGSGTGGVMGDSPPLGGAERTPGE